MSVKHKGWTRIKDAKELLRVLEAGLAVGLCMITHVHEFDAGSIDNLSTIGILRNLTAGRLYRKTELGQ
jgi:methionyl-tRNA formyltransferase